MVVAVVVVVDSDRDLCVCVLVFTGEELRDTLMPTWMAVYQMYPHSLAFRQPVDPVLERIPVSNYIMLISVRAVNVH